MLDFIGLGGGSIEWWFRQFFLAGFFCGSAGGFWEKWVFCGGEFVVFVW